MSEPMVKGAVIREFLSWYQEKHGDERVLEMARRAPPELKSLLDPKQPIVNLLPASWYPARLVHSMLETLKEGMTDAEFARLAKEANRTLVRKGMSTVYRLFLEKLVTPEMYALGVPRMWRQLHSTGVRRMRIVGPGEAESVVAAWDGHHPLLCTVIIETMCALFEHMGKKDVKWDRIACVSTGAAECVTRLTWTD